MRRRDLEDKAKILVRTGNLQDVRALAGIAHARITLVDRNGNVMADSNADPVKMEIIYLGRPEIAEALQGKSLSHSVRWSQNPQRKVSLSCGSD